MQAEPPRPDGSDLPPSSPTLSSALHRHHPPETRDRIRDPSPSAPTTSLRHRPPFSTRPSASGSDDTLRLYIATPFSDHASSASERRASVLARKEWAVAHLKDRLAAGEGTDEAWEREGMRLVWQGRMIRDEEKLGEAIMGREGEGQTVHLVARRKASGSSTALLRPMARQIEPIAEVRPPTAASLAISAPTASEQNQDFDYLVMSDILHYMRFTERHHLSHIVGLPPLRWYNTDPPPTVDQDVARQAVISALRILVPETELGARWTGGWEQAFRGDSPEDVRSVWVELGGRAAAEQAVREQWRLARGRTWTEGSQGESLAVVLDMTPYQLHLPPLASQTASQLVHLLIYLRITFLLPAAERYVNSLQLRELAGSTSSPLPQLPLATPPRTQAAQESLLVRRELWSVIFFASVSAFKIVAMVWMLTRGMRWSDIRLWIIGGAAAGWWIGDAAQQLRAEVRRLRRQNRQDTGTPGVPAGRGGQAGADAVGPERAGVGAAHPTEPQAAHHPHPPRAGQPARPAATPPTLGKTLPWLIPSIQLQHDSRLLQVPLSATYGPMGELDQHLNAIYPQREGQMRQRARQIPPWYVRWVVLPVLLWIITLVPDWEAFRSRAIRKRERAMRVVVGELTAARRAERLAVGETLGPAEGEEEGEETVYPEELTREARKYYERVMQRGEGIDWEEEREAQRAMGIQDEEEERARAWRW